MKKSFILLLLIGNLIQMSAQITGTEAKERERMFKNKVIRQTQWQYDYINGKPTIQGIKNSVSSFDKNGNLIQLINYDVNGKCRSVVVYTYDNNNNKTSYSRFSDSLKTLTYNQKILYNQKGLKVAETGFDGASAFTNTFTYNDQDKISTIIYKSDNRITEQRVFKHTRNTTEMTIMNANNVVLSKETTMFDNKNNVLEETKYVQDNVTQRSSYSYDPVTGKKVEESKENLGNLAYKRKYTYNAQGFITQITEEKQDVKPFISYMYKYDAKGNLIEEKWTKEPNSEYSTKSHKYDTKGLLVETESYNATFKVPVIYRYTYVFQ